jgi:hypothetical protein
MWFFYCHKKSVRLTWKILTSPGQQRYFNLSSTHWEYIVRTMPLIIQQIFWSLHGRYALSWNNVFILVCFSFSHRDVTKKEQIPVRCSSIWLRVTDDTVLPITCKLALHWRILCPQKRCSRMDNTAARKLDKESRTKGFLFIMLCYSSSFNKLGTAKGELFPFHLEYTSSDQFSEDYYI